MTNHVHFLVLPHLHILDLAGPLQVMATVQELGIAPLAVQCIGPQEAVPAFQHLLLRQVQPLPARLAGGDLLFVIGSKLDERLMASRPWREAVDWLRELKVQPPGGVRIAGVCTGAFVLADAGLLDGRLCTTHHRFTDMLRRRCPQAHVADNRLCVNDGPIWTSAGVASGIDLALRMVAERHGEDAAIQVARENVVPLRRFGGDPALSARMDHRSHGNDLVHRVQDAMATGLAAGDSCAALAAAFGLSDRHLARLFRAETGITMKRYQTALRMDLARRLVVDTALPLERIAERCGFGSVQALRAQWDRHETSTPSALRAQAARTPR
ncbi:helix-turn-helix domain-containing protein [Aquincola sp. MAHUQ-54]|uniref:Helix-turn-helix domain-containing protein n=1 Tax=Aquincola agrisoli TaxID=3119538 RepID=A0AAW9Q3R9_9BURK